MISLLILKSSSSEMINILNLFQSLPITCSDPALIILEVESPLLVVLHTIATMLRPTPPVATQSGLFSCDLIGDTAKTCYKIHGYPPKNARPQALLAHSKASDDQNWLLDSRASHHVTKDLANLSVSSKYNGSDQLVVANCKGLPIEHSGSTSIPTSSTPIHLSNVLHVPFVTQNLISVSQLCKTNNVSIEFFPSHFEVKSLSMGTVLLRGKNDDHVYRLPSKSNPQTFQVHCLPSSL